MDQLVLQRTFKSEVRALNHIHPWAAIRDNPSLDFVEYLLLGLEKMDVISYGISAA
jgi:hypothetical protein